MAFLREQTAKVSDLFERRSVRAALYVLFGAVLIVTSMRIVKPADPVGSLSRSRSDFEDYYRAAVMTARGEDPYRMDQLKRIMELPRTLKPQDLADPARFQDLLLLFSGVGTYLYLPLTAFLLQPLTLLDYQAAALVFQIGSSGALAVCAYLLFRFRSQPERQFSGAFLPALVLLAGFLSENAANGNIATFLILLTAAGLVLSFEKSWKWSAAGGFLLGTAVILKITPAFLLLVPFAFLRVFSLIGAGAGIAAGLSLPALAFGVHRTLALTEGWYRLIIETYSKYVFLRPWANNQTISGAVGKWFLPGSDLKQAEAGLPFLSGIPDESVTLFLANAVRISNAALWAIAFLCACLVAWSVYRKNFQGMLRAVFGGAAEGAVLSPYSARFARLAFVCTLVSLVTAGVSWYHAYSVLLLPVYLRFCAVLEGEPLRTGEKISLAVLGAFSLLHPLLSSHTRDLIALYSVFTVAVVCMILYSAGLLVTGRAGKPNGI